MLTPPTLVRRWPLALVTTVASVTFTAGMIAGLLVHRAPPEQPKVIDGCFMPPAAVLTVRVSPRYQGIDLLSPDTYQADGTLDEVFDVELNAALAVRHIFINGNGGYHQWDTVVGDESIPFGRVFGGQRGDATWNLGVRENGQWRTSTRTGALGEIAAGTHHLELIGNGVYDSPGPRTVTVMFVDGTTVTAEVAQPAPTSSYASQLGG